MRKKKYTCVSLNINDVATSKRFGLDKYLFSLNCFSNSKSCCDVNAVRGLLDLVENTAELHT